MPIEGRWYTGIFRNALIAVMDNNGSVYNRDLQTSTQIGLWEGGNEIVRDPEHFIRYAGIANQYFASVIVVDKDQADQKFLSRARPTLETALAKGKIAAINSDRLDLTRSSNLTETYYFSDRIRSEIGSFRWATKWPCGTTLTRNTNSTATWIPANGRRARSSMP